MKLKVGGYVVDGNGIHKETFLEKHGKTIAAVTTTVIGTSIANAMTKKEKTSSNGANKNTLDRS